MTGKILCATDIGYEISIQDEENSQDYDILLLEDSISSNPTVKVYEKDGKKLPSLTYKQLREITGNELYLTNDLGRNVSMQEKRTKAYIDSMLERLKSATNKNFVAYYPSLVLYEMAYFYRREMIEKYLDAFAPYFANMQTNFPNKMNLLVDSVVRNFVSTHSEEKKYFCFLMLCSGCFDPGYGSRLPELAKTYVLNHLEEDNPFLEKYLSLYPSFRKDSPQADTLFQKHNGLGIIPEQLIPYLILNQKADLLHELLMTGEAYDKKATASGYPLLDCFRFLASHGYSSPEQMKAMARRFIRYEGFGKAYYIFKQFVTDQEIIEDINNKLYFYRNTISPLGIMSDKNKEIQEVAESNRPSGCYYYSTYGYSSYILSEPFDPDFSMSTYPAEDYELKSIRKDAKERYIYSYSINHFYSLMLKLIRYHDKNSLRLLSPSDSRDFEDSPYFYILKVLSNKELGKKYENLYQYKE